MADVSGGWGRDEAKERERELASLREQLERQSLLDRQNQKKQEKQAGEKPKEQTIFVAYRENMSGSGYNIEGSVQTLEGAEEVAKNLLKTAPSRTVLFLQPVARMTAETVFKREAV